MTSQHTLRVPVLADLKALPVSPGAIVPLIGKATPGDGLGGFYRWGPVTTGSEDWVGLPPFTSLGASVPVRFRVEEI